MSSINFIKRLLIVGLVIFSTKINSQNEYIITTKGDTLFGNVIRGNVFNNIITIKREGKKEKIRMQEVKEYKNGYMPIFVVLHEYKNKKYWLELLQEVDGEKKLFRDIFDTQGSIDYFTLVDEKYVELTPKYIENIFIHELKKCTLFAEKLGNSKIRKFQLKRILTDYNALCTNK